MTQLVDVATTLVQAEPVTDYRRGLFGTAAMTIAAATLGTIGSAKGQCSTTVPADS